MANDDREELRQDLAQSVDALRIASENEERFRLLVESFRAQDHPVFRNTLDRIGILDRCDLVCHWLCSKECTLLCFELSGPPLADQPELDLRKFGSLISRVAADSEALERLASAVLERDEIAFGGVIEHLGLQQYAHYICRWICAVRCRLVREILCRPDRPYYLVGCSHLVTALQQAASAVARVISDERVLGPIVKGVLAHDCEIVREAVERGGLQGVCHWICEWICTWRCARACFILCRTFPALRIDDELAEIHGFARTLGGQPPEILVELLKAVESEDEKRYVELLKQHGLERYCFQLCHWLCHLVCRRFCFCVCRPPRPRPWFTHVGHFHIYADIDATSGLTNKAVLSHGGPDYGFFGCFELRGFCPATSPTVSGAPMRYRFLYERSGTTSPLVGDLICSVIVGSRTIFWDVNGTGLEETFQTVQISGSGATPDPTPPPAVPPGTPWGPPPTHVVVPDPDGWITVDANALGGGFNGALLGFDSSAAFPGGPPTPTVAAGSQIPVGDLKEGVDVAIIFEATRVGGPTSPPDYSNTLSRIHINNWEDIRLLDLLQFHTGGGSPCSPLSTDLDIEYTTDHELMLAWEIGISTAASIPPLTLPSGAATRAVGAQIAFGTHHEDISSWPSCSYTVTLSSIRTLTTGLSDDAWTSTSKTFCK